MAGDGLLVRVRPPLARLTAQQVEGLCEAAKAHGNGQIDLTARANLQLRGVTEAGWPALLAELQALGLVDPDPVREGRGAILVDPCGARATTRTASPPNCAHGWLNCPRCRARSASSSMRARGRC